MDKRETAEEGKETEAREKCETASVSTYLRLDTVGTEGQDLLIREVNSPQDTNMTCTLFLCPLQSSSETISEVHPLKMISVR